VISAPENPSVKSAQKSSDTLGATGDLRNTALKIFTREPLSGSGI
jgi:hypothetical protein